jgi:hypothetical protein
VERSAVLVFDTWFLFSLGRAYWVRRRANTVQKREWITRAVGTLLGIATTRPVMGAFFATSRLTHLQPNQFVGIAFWVGFSINVLVIELWLHSKWHARLHNPELPLGTWNSRHDNACRKRAQPHRSIASRTKRPLRVSIMTEQDTIPALDPSLFPCAVGKDAKRLVRFKGLDDVLIEGGQMNGARACLRYQQTVEGVRVQETHMIESADVPILQRQLRA